MYTKLPGYSFIFFGKFLPAAFPDGLYRIDSSRPAVLTAGIRI